MALIIIVPISVLAWVSYGPTNLDSIKIDAVYADTKDVDGLFILATAQGSGRDFADKADLRVKHDNEEVYSGKVQFNDGYLAYKLLYEDFCVGNGDYQFRLMAEGLSSTYDYELDQVAEYLRVVGTATHNYQGDGAEGVKPWNAVYVYSVVFMTDWNFFTHDIGPSKFASYDLGSMFVGQSAPLKVETGPEHGVTVEVWFTDNQGEQSKIQTYDVAAGSNLDETLTVHENGSFIYKYVNHKTVDIEIKALENRGVDKIPEGGSMEIRQELGAAQDTETVPIIETSRLKGYTLPKLGPGHYDITFSYPNPQMKPSSPLSVLTSTEEDLLLNDLPKANPIAEPNRLTTLQRTITFKATDSFDDGPKEDLYVYWSMGLTDNGQEIDSFEGTWEEMEILTYTYAFGEDPDISKGRPYLILKDAYGAESAKVFVDFQVG